MRNMLLSGVCVTALALLAPGVSQAQELGDGWYVSMFGGLSAPRTLNGNAYYNTINYSLKNKFKDGFILGMAVGKSISDNVRGELEFAFASHDPKSRVETYPGGTNTYNGTGGRLQSYTVLGNLWYDFNNDSGFTPYLGGGIGIGFIDSNIRWSALNVYDDTDTVFAFQIGAGVKYALGPALSLGLDYRYKGLVDFDLDQTGSAVPGYGPDTGLDLYTHNIMINLTYAFGP